MYKDEKELQKALVTILRESPGLPARAIARELRDMLAREIFKADINPILYRERSLFRFDGYSPPRWFLIPPSPKPTLEHLPQTLPSRSDVPPPIGGPVPAKRPVPGLPHPALPSHSGAVRRPTLPDQPRLRLHDWQIEAIASWRRNGGRGIVEAVTGTGKSTVAVEILRNVLAEGKRALVLVPSIALLNQWQTVLRGDLDLEVTSLFAGGARRQLDLQWGTYEDPAAAGDEVGRFQELRANADNAVTWDAAMLRFVNLEELIFEWIWNPR